MGYVYSLENLVKTLNTEKGKELAEKAKKAYEENYANQPITVLSYAKYKLIHETGERAPFEDEYFDRRNRLRLLQILAVYDKKYITDLEDLLSAICEEYTWVLPAHCKRSFGRFDYSEIDLFSSETALYLSETVFVLKDLLSKDIKSRIHERLYERIVRNFENRNFVFDELQNNWCAVCGAGVGVTYLYAFPECFDRIKDRIFKLMEQYLLSIGEDGYCVEGTNYWQYGFGFFALFFDVYVNMTGDYPEILKRKKVVNTVKFLNDVYLGGKKYLPYGDGGVKEFTGYLDIYSCIKNLFKKEFTLPKSFGADFIDETLSGDGVKAFKKGLGFRVINAINLFGNEVSKDDTGFKYFETGEVVIYRNKNYAFTTKCGSNGVSHAHNDVGAFEIVKDNKRLIADLGAGEYTWGYFNDNKVRYGDEIFVCGSQSHSVPIIDGKREKEIYGRGKVLSVDDKAFKMDIGGAYQNAINSLIVDYVWKDKELDVSYEYADQVEHQITYRFISDYAPVIKDGKVVIEDTLTIECDKALEVKFDCKEYSIRRGDKLPAYIIDFVADKAKSDKVNFKFIVK